METIGRSYLKLFMLEQRAKGRALWWSREIDPTRQQNGFHKHHQNVAGDGFSFSLSVRKCIHPVTASSAQTNAISEEIQTIYSDKPKTVHVRFKLVKECLFGQQFVIVGNDPIIGSWDPSEGVPLDWSEGHVWTAELDIPSGNVFEYKFILKGETGGISWQPGPDRIFVTWDTDKTITVCEDWDNPQLQLILEEEPVIVPDVNDEPLIDSDLLMVAENLFQPLKEEEDEAVNSDFSVADSNLNLPLLDEETHMIEEVLASVNGHANHTSALIVADNVIAESGEQDSIFSDEGSGLTSVADLKRSSEDETRIVEDEGVPVLVPGLVIPVPPGDAEAAELNDAVESNVTVENTTIEPDFIEDHHSTKPEIINQLEEEHVSASSSSSLMDPDEKRQAVGADHVENKSILGTDMQWGRRTLQKLLANFGFSMNS